MDVVFADKRSLTPLGKQGENEVTKIKFKKEDWEERFGIGFYTLFNQRPNDPAPYPCITEDEGRFITWVVKSSDLAQKGQGMCQLVYTVDSKVAKSVIFHTIIFDSLGDDSEEPPEPWSGWVQEVIDAKDDAIEAAEEAETSADRAEEASGHYPYINETNFHWMVWDVEAGEYVDTGIGAKGGSVYSVNGKDGDVHLDAEDVGALPDDTYIPTKTSDLTNDSDFATNASVTSAVAAETTRATAAEQTINGNVNDEISRATDAEEALDAKIDSEITRAQNAEDVLEQALQTEQGRAEVAEDELSARITAETDRATAAEATKASATALSEEITRATGAEQTIQESVNSEVTRAEAAETTLRQSISAEVARAEAAEAEIAQDLSDEVTRATAAESNLSDAINAEESRAEGAESTLDGKITSEISRATTAEDTIAASVTAETNRATTAENAISASVTAETNRAIAVEATKVDKVEGKGLSSNDYTTAEKNKLAGIAEGAEVNVQSDWNQTSTSADDYIKNKPDLSVYALDADLESHITDYQNPHRVTKEQVGLGNADNTSDANKPISTATQDALNLKADVSALTAEVNRATAVENLKADKAVVSFFDRRMRYIYEHSEKQYFDIEDDTTPAYTKTLPSGVIGVGVNMIGGKSYVKNQKQQNNDFSTPWIKEAGVTASFDNGVATVSTTVAVNGILFRTTDTDIVNGNIYYLMFDYYVTDNELLSYNIYSGILSTTVSPTEYNKWVHHTDLKKASDSASEGPIYLLCRGANGTEKKFRKPFTVNMTQWFGVTETSQVTDEMKRIVESYLADHPEYNAGSIISADCDEVDSSARPMTMDDAEVKTFSFRPTGSFLFVPFTRSGRYTISFTDCTFNSNYLKVTTLATPTSISDFRDVAVLYKANVPINYSFDITETSGFIVLCSDSGQTFNKTSITNLKIVYENAIDSFSIPQGLRQAHPLRSAGSAHDEYDFNGKFTNVNTIKINLGDLNWTKYANRIGGFYTSYDAITEATEEPLDSNVVCAEYTPIAENSLVRIPDKSIAKTFSNNQRRIYVVNESYEGKTASEFKELVAGIYVYLKRATPIYYYDPTSPELSVNGGTVVPDATHIVDPESYFPTASNLLNAEAGGSITFHQDGDTEFPIPNSTTYLVNTDAAAQS